MGMKIFYRLKVAAQVSAATLMVVLLLEIFLRVGGYFWYNHSQYYLLYGFHTLVGRLGVSPWSVYVGDYYKFPPNYTLRGAAGQGAETARTNSLGFRGPDFDPAKPEGTFRIICLGGSSTFGFHNSDTGTYPYRLQQLFTEPIGGLSVEVINAGFPYYTTASIRSLVEQEVLKYDPDILTIYSAFNDAGWPLHIGALTRTLFWLQQHSIIYLFLKETIITDDRVYKMKHELRQMMPSTEDVSHVDRAAEQVALRYRENVEAILTLAVARKTRVVLIRQPMTTRTYNEHLDASYSYQEEYEAVRQKISDGAHLSPLDYVMIKHHRIIEELDVIALRRNLPVVDNIAVVDEDRNRLTSWVHLTEEANGRLAQVLKEVILSLVVQRGGHRAE